MEGNLTVLRCADKMDVFSTGGADTIQGSWLVKSNAETGEGYSNISIQTKGRLGIEIRVEYAFDGNLEEACREVLEQSGMKKIVKYGIDFYEKMYDKEGTHKWYLLALRTKQSSSPARPVLSGAAWCWRF